tara:strand:+ start:117 stop:593 length:477 start_codon:yes stop_codon:yes gene_type:complete
MEYFSWIDEYEPDEYDNLYKSGVESVEISYLYVNKDNELFYVKTERFLLNEGAIDKEQLIFLLKKNMIYNKKRFVPLSILKYNINISKEDIMSFLDGTDEYNFITHEKYFNRIYWDDTISLLNDLNSLYIIFYEKKSNKNNTKRISIGRKNKTKRYLK